MGRELGKVGPTGEMNGRLASPRAQKLALGEETPLLSIELVLSRHLCTTSCKMRAISVFDFVIYVFCYISSFESLNVSRCICCFNTYDGLEVPGLITLI
jgi:hypothetical protein